MATKNGRTLIYELRGYLLFLIVIFTLSCSSVKGKVEAIASQPALHTASSKPDALSPTEIEELLSLTGESYIEVARFPIQMPFGFYKYQQYEPAIQGLVNQLESYHRFIVQSSFKKEWPGNVPIYETYYRVLVGPFDKEQAAQELGYLINSGYQDASIHQLIVRYGTEPPELFKLWFLYTKNHGPKFITSSVHNWGGYIEYVVEPKSGLLLFHFIGLPYEISDTVKERFVQGLFFANGKDGTIHILEGLNGNGFIMLPNRKVLVVRSFSVAPSGDESEIRRKIDKDGLMKAAKEIGVAPNKLQVNYVGNIESAEVSALFEFDLETRQLKSLRLCGGLGGIFSLKDGTIYLSNSATPALYADSRITPEEQLDMVGKRPYYLFNPKKRTLVKMADEFIPNASEIVQPFFAMPHFSEGMKTGIKTIAEVGIVKLFYLNGTFYLQH
jgi:hypothetical protein